MSERTSREQFTARQLAERGDTTVRTVHYYVSEGLLPPPEGATRSAAYTMAHLARLRIIAALRAEGLSLAAIRVRIEQLGDDDVRELLGTLERYADEIDAGEITVLGLIEAAVVSPPVPASPAGHAGRRAGGVLGTHTARGRSATRFSARVCRAHVAAC